MLNNTDTSLIDLTYETIIKFLWLWKPAGTNLIASTRTMRTYLLGLPIQQRNELYDRFVISAKGDIKHFVQAWHVAAFLQCGQTELKLWFDNPCFDFQFLLQSCSSILFNLEVLELPGRSSLPATLCQSMCNLMPHLTKLDLCGINICDDAIPFLATLPLTVLNIEDTDVLDDGLLQLCVPTSKARLTLLDLRIEERTKLNTCCHLLKSIPQLEYLGFNNCKLLSSLPIEMMKNKLSLRRLDYAGLPEPVALALAIAVDLCPRLDTLHLNVREFTPEILHSLTKFQKLETLTLSNHLNVYNLDELSIYFKNFLLSKLRTLCLDRIDVNWFLRGHFLSLLLMCPVLKSLSLSHCVGFNDKIAAKMAKILANGKINGIKLKCCNLITSKAIRDMLTIPSLYELLISLAIPSQRAKDFDVVKLKNEANDKNVNLKLSIFCYYRECECSRDS